VEEDVKKKKKFLFNIRNYFIFYYLFFLYNKFLLFHIKFFSLQSAALLDQIRNPGLRLKKRVTKEAGAVAKKDKGEEG
jgi:hypothetical protein